MANAAKPTAQLLLSYMLCQILLIEGFASTKHRLISCRNWLSLMCWVVAGDVGLHALTDAILGALCLPDIGQLFPDTDPKWKGANSDTFIKEAVRLNGNYIISTCMSLQCFRSSCWYLDNVCVRHS